MLVPRGLRRSVTSIGLLACLLLSSMLASPVAVAAAVGPCGTGTAFFGSAPTDTKFFAGDTWQGATFTSIVNNDPAVNDVMNARIVVTGDQVGRFPSDDFGASATIVFPQPVLITGILWYGNQPNSGEAGWTFNGISAPLTGDHGAACQSVSLVTDTITITTDESGGIDFWFQPVPEPEGCTPGYWKNHPASWAGTGYATNQSLEWVFDIADAFGLDNVSLLIGLSLQGGSTLSGAASILLRASVAALLNAAHPSVDYQLTTAQILSQVNAALASGNRSTMLALATNLDNMNNAGCPLN